MQVMSPHRGEAAQPRHHRGNVATSWRSARGALFLAVLTAQCTVATAFDMHQSESVPRVGPLRVFPLSGMAAVMSRVARQQREEVNLQDNDFRARTMGPSCRARDGPGRRDPDWQSDLAPAQGEARHRELGRTWMMRSCGSWLEACTEGPGSVEQDERENGIGFRSTCVLVQEDGGILKTAHGILEGGWGLQPQEPSGGGAMMYQYCTKARDEGFAGSRRIHGCCGMQGYRTAYDSDDEGGQLRRESQLEVCEASLNAEVDRGAGVLKWLEGDDDDGDAPQPPIGKVHFHGWHGATLLGLRGGGRIEEERLPQPLIAGTRHEEEVVLCNACGKDCKRAVDLRQDEVSSGTTRGIAVGPAGLLQRPHCGCEIREDSLGDIALRISIDEAIRRQAEPQRGGEGH